MSLIDEFSKSDINTVSMIVEAVDLYLAHNKRLAIDLNLSDPDNPVMNYNFEAGSDLTSNEKFVIECFREILLKSMQNIEDQIEQNISNEASSNIDNLIQDLYKHLATED